MNGGTLKTLLAVVGVLGLAVAAPAFAVNAHGSRHHHHVALRMSADDPGLKSAAAYVVDQDDSAVWYSRNATVASPIASITKLMTALVVADAHQPLDEVLQITAEDRAVGKGAASRLAVGTKLTRGDLLHLALMSSENRAAHALGRNYPGGIAAFARAMNEKAQSLGMTSSHFVEPTGLSSDNVASPEDLSRLVMAAARNPTIRDFSTDTQHSVRIGRRMVEFRTTDALVRNPAWNIIVQKTGYITEAGRCLVMQAVIGGRNVVIVLLNSFGKYTRVADAVRMRKWIEARMSEHAAHALASSNS
ncbi:MAG TPA: D-alanyl-D-alanine endopeptidase [Steroidobacteraceae bacterium]|jgi:D-alanyl-D-alanine endopeptidase (penicillin-binding protein 7)|nr:D-alanyl-D-alanine endopeptidase [Steroidobacteraceae bacterium]